MLAWISRTCQQIVQSAYEFHHGDTSAKLKEILSKFDLQAIGGIAATASTPSILKMTSRYDDRVAVVSAVRHFHPQAGSILVVGGEKFGLIRLDGNGDYLGFKSNTGCAAGTGSFIEEQAQKLGCPLSQYSERAAYCPSPMASDRCTVFMERDLNHYLNAGYPVDDLLAAVLHSVCENYLSKVADEKSIGEVVFFQGATAKNKSLVAAFEKRLGQSIRVSRYCHLAGALGVALMLRDQAVFTTTFRGLSLFNIVIPLRSEICNLCTNHCKLTVAEVVAKSPGAYPILMTAFKSAPDSFVIDYFKQVMESHGKPYRILQLDEHDSKGGYETRIESALRTFQNHFSAKNSGGPNMDRPTMLPSKSLDLADKILIIPNWDPISCRLIAANLRRGGIDAHCLEETPSGIQRSMRHNSGQCIPLNIIAEEFIDYIRAHRLDPSRSVLWLPEGEIACNLKLYPYHIRFMLNALGNGMEWAHVYAGTTSMIDISISLPGNNYFAYMFGGMLRRMGCKIRPYERHRGQTDEVIESSVEILVDAFLGKRSKEDAIAEIVFRFEQIETDKEYDGRPRPKVAIFGDLYARDNHLINQDLIHFIEDNGGRCSQHPTVII